MAAMVMIRGRIKNEEIYFLLKLQGYTRLDFINNNNDNNVF